MYVHGHNPNFDLYKAKADFCKSEYDFHKYRLEFKMTVISSDKHSKAKQTKRT